MKRLLSLILAVMLLCSLTIPAFADATIDTTQTGSVELWKYDLSSAQADGVWDSSYVSTGVRDQNGVEAILGASGGSSGYAIQGVVYTYLKVASLNSVTVTDNNVERSELLYGIVNNAANTAFLTAIGVSANDRYAPADETDNGVTTYYFRSDTLITGLQNALTSNATTVKNALESYVANNGGTAMTATDANGHSAASDLPLGLYLFVETSVPEQVTSTTAPFLISIPMTSTTASGSSWIYDVVVYPKNLTGLPTLDKTVREAKTSTGKNNGTAGITDGYAASATASAGDTVEYQIISTLPSITSAASYLSQYTFVDTLPAGLTYARNDVVLEFYSEAACTNKIATWNAASEKFTVAYTSGANGESIMTITPTTAGLTEINTSSAVYTGASAVNSGYSDCTLRITYSATLDTDSSLVLGDTGNPNEVTLTWKRSNASYYDTLTDNATVYCFGLDVTKNFSDGRGDATNVEFLIQNSTDSYYLTGSLNTTENVWYVTGKTSDAANATHFTPNASGKLTVKGVEDDAYTLTEVKTDAAYTLLKSPVQVVITKSGATVSATVDGNAVNMSAVGISAHALAPFTIINTRGFDLPQTGGTGKADFDVSKLANLNDEPLYALFVPVDAAGTVIGDVYCTPVTKENADSIQVPLSTAAKNAAGYSVLIAQKDVPVYTVEIHYLDKDDTARELKAAYTLSVVKNAKYDVSAFVQPDIAGYHYVSASPAELTGTATEDLWVEALYEKNPPALPHIILLGNTEACAADSVPLVIKEVKEDSTGIYGKTNDARIGQLVEFKSAVTVYGNSRDVLFHDRMDKGLSFSGRESVRVFTDRELTRELDPKSYVILDTPDEDDSFTIRFTDAYLESFSGTKTLYVAYTAVLNADALSGGALYAQINRSWLTVSKQMLQMDETATVTHKLMLSVPDSLSFRLFEADTEQALGFVKLDESNYRVAMDGENALDAIPAPSGIVTLWGLDAETYRLYTESGDSAGLAALAGAVSAYVQDGGAPAAAGVGRS